MSHRDRYVAAVYCSGSPSVEARGRGALSGLTSAGSAGFAAPPRATPRHAPAAWLPAEVRPSPGPARPAASLLGQRGISLIDKEVHDCRLAGYRTPARTPAARGGGGQTSTWANWAHSPTRHQGKGMGAPGNTSKAMWKSARAEETQPTDGHTRRYVSGRCRALRGEVFSVSSAFSCI